MAEQLAFDLPVRPALGRGDFFVSEANAFAVARLDQSATWPGGKLALVGPEGAGKTHLAHVWAAGNGARIVSAADLAEIDVAAAAEHPVVVEDADRMPRSGETPLFHLHNLVAERRGALLLTARTPPSRWPVALPDLRSRMEAAEVARIDAPDDALLAAVLLKHFSDRQIDVHPDLIGFLARRIDRSFGAAEQVVAELDAAALRSGRALTVPFARGVLDNTEGGTQ